ncbi:MAG: hypothetical protein KDD69_13615 [Bdellovibrionales bacterium]|nr:hypothetical protein [Bdellovibrionales bacterium]
MSLKRSSRASGPFGAGVLTDFFFLVAFLAAGFSPFGFGDVVDVDFAFEALITTTGLEDPAGAEAAPFAAALAAEGPPLGLTPLGLPSFGILTPFLELRLKSGCEA